MERESARLMGLLVAFTIIFGLFNTPTAWAVPNIVRGPYLQKGTPNSVTVKWRTNENANSKVWYGTSLGILDQSVTDSELKTDHTIQVLGLNPATKYYYQVGTADETELAGGDASHYFVTSPNPGSSGPVRIWVLGDSGRANNNARAVKNAYLELAGNEAREADIWLMLGDNAYGSGTDSEYQNAVFNMYPEILRNKVLWPTRGNNSSSTVYYDIFDFPTNGESGGTPSGTEHYYSFDYANIHFICLNSEERDLSESPDSVMNQWLEEDLVNTQQKWIIAFWHHPPYSKGSHNSDIESKLIYMRQNTLPILEAGGVDLVLAGHSHSYERSLFINGHYAHSSSFDPGVHVVQAGSGREGGDGAYVKSGDDGTVYIVAGSSSGVGGGSMDHPVMYFGERQLGSLIIDVQGDRMDARFLREFTNPIQVDDYFTIQSSSPAARLVAPANGLTDVPPRGVVLGWIPGEYASKHDVYFGTNFDDVKEATGTVDPGAVYLARQDSNYYPISGALDLGETYYWRVDEVNAPPDSTVYPGEVWSFTTEPVGYPIDGANITATASGSFGVASAENTINGSGLVGDLHGSAAGDMWISGGMPATIEYAFDRLYKLQEVWIWNSNQLEIEAFAGSGAKDVVIEHSLDGESWTVLEGVGPLTQGPGLDGYTHNNVVNFGGAVARHVRVTVNSVHGTAPQASLSEVRFYFIPVYAREPQPESGAADVVHDVTLSWGRDGREAGSHDVYVGADSSNLPLAGSVSESSFDTLAVDLQLSQTYYWRVDEVNDAMEPSTWTGDVWSFTTVGAIVIDDMESYKDEELLEIWATWIDGSSDPDNNGARVGANPGIGDFSPESTIVHGDNQSLPIHYDNSGAAQSEATRTFAVAQDWTRAGVTTLVVWFHGAAGNSGQMYLKINGTKIPFDGPAGNIGLAAWQAWSVDLASLGMNLQSVRSLTVGIEGNGATGTLYVDDIALEQSAAEAINEWRVSAGSDDGEEHVLDGAVMESLTSSDLELGHEGNMAPAALQTIGCRWVGVGVPQGATITEAWVQFSADDVDNPYHALPVSLVIEGELSPNPETFAATAGSVTGRHTTSAEVVWDVSVWLTVHAMGPEERSPDISSIIQEIVNQPDWSGAAIVLMFADNPANPLSSSS